MGVPGTRLDTLRDVGCAALCPMLAALLVAVTVPGLEMSAIFSRNRVDAEPVAPAGSRPLVMIAGFIVFVPLIHLVGMINAGSPKTPPARGFALCLDSSIPYPPRP